MEVHLIKEFYEFNVTLDELVRYFGFVIDGSIDSFAKCYNDNEVVSDVVLTMLEKYVEERICGTDCYVSYTLQFSEDASGMPCYYFRCYNMPY